MQRTREYPSQYFADVHEKKNAWGQKHCYLDLKIEMETETETATALAMVRTPEQPPILLISKTLAVCLRSPLAPRLDLPGHRHAPPLPRKSSRNPLLHTPAAPERNPRQPPISRGWTMRTQERGGLGFLAFQGCFPVLAVLQIY